MSITSAKGFIAGVATANLRSDGTNDVAVVINNGPLFNAAAVFTSNQVKAAPVLWSQEAIKSKIAKAVLLNSGGANACTGAKGFENTHQSAEVVANFLGISANHVQVCSTGLIGKHLNMQTFIPAINQAISNADASQGLAAARAIMTTDSKPKETKIITNGFTIGGMIKGAGMLAPNLATMLCVLTTDAIIDSENIEIILKKCVKRTLNRIDSDGCTSTNDTVILLASGASEVTPNIIDFENSLMQVLTKLSQLLIGDAEGSTKDIKISVLSASNEEMAEAAARAVARNNLFKAAMFGSDPNWGRIIAALGTIEHPFDQFAVDVKINGKLYCHKGEQYQDSVVSDLSGRLIDVEIAFNLGEESATIWTNDLSEKYVYENSAYSS
jgi:glutamate N-acetyltransferase / amino-acid N-acetyltransferase